jgi:predicted lipoprotein with Yx(FWY)xxD motif
MLLLKRSIPITVVLLIAFLLAACGSSTSTGSTTPTATTSPSTPTPTTSPATPTATTGSNASALIHTAMVTVSGKSETILTNAQGSTLYYRTSDTATSVCSGGCAQAWPPVISSAGTPTSSTTLPGKLGVETNANGQQVTYNGHPLYTFASDTAAGQTNGQGVGGVWFVAQTTLS